MRANNGTGFMNMSQPERITVNKLDRQTERQELIGQRIRELSTVLGYDMNDALILQDSIKKEITEGRVDNKSVVMWVEYCRQSMKNMEIDGQSIGGMMARFVEAMAKDNGKTIECKVYPLVVYREYKSPKNIDLVVDVDVDPENDSSRAIPITIKFKTSEDNSLTVSIDKMYKKAVNIVIPEIIDSLEKNVQNRFLKEVSLAICETVDDAYHKIHGYPSGLLQHNSTAGRDQLTTNIYNEPHNFNSSRDNLVDSMVRNDEPRRIYSRDGKTIVRRRRKKQ